MMGRKMQQDLTTGNEKRAMVLFALPMIAGNILQQLYNIADTMVVGRFIGTDALAAVGSSFALMVFITSVMIGLCMGSGVVFSMLYGKKDEKKLRQSIFVSFVMIFVVTLLIYLLSVWFLSQILQLLQLDFVVQSIAKEYLQIILIGLFFTFLYNFMAAFLRSIGNSLAPVLCIAVASVVNIVLDLWFVLGLDAGVAGAAWATVLAQVISAVLLWGYAWHTQKARLRPDREMLCFDGGLAKTILQYSTLTSIQQSIMNFGILMVQGLVNSFGVAATAAFAAAVKIDAFAYMPVQDFGNAFSTYIAQNYGAGKKERIEKGIRSALQLSGGFGLLISLIVVLFASVLMQIFVDASETQIIKIGVEYLRIEGSFYLGIGFLFLLYGFYRGIGRSGMSVVLTVVSLGTRVALAYLLAPMDAIGLPGIWWAIPIGWLLADLIGFGYYLKHKNKLLA